MKRIEICFAFKVVSLDFLFSILILFIKIIRKSAVCYVFFNVTHLCLCFCRSFFTGIVPIRRSLVPSVFILKCSDNIVIQRVASKKENSVYVNRAVVI